MVFEVYGDITDKLEENIKSISNDKVELLEKQKIDITKVAHPDFFWFLEKNKDFDKNFKKKFPVYEFQEVKNKKKFFLTVEAVGEVDINEILDEIFLTAQKVIKV